MRTAALQGQLNQLLSRVAALTAEQQQRVEQSLTQCLSIAGENAAADTTSATIAPEAAPVVASASALDKGKLIRGGCLLGGSITVITTVYCVSALATPIAPQILLTIDMVGSLAIFIGIIHALSYAHDVLEKQKAQAAAPPA